MKDRNGRLHGPNGRFVKMAGSIAGGDKAKRKSGKSTGLRDLVQSQLDLPDKSAPLTGKETIAQIRAIADAEGITLGRTGNRADLARSLEQIRFNRDHGGARFFATENGEVGGRNLHSSSGSSGSMSTVARKVAASSPRSKPRKAAASTVHVDHANQDLAGLSARQLKAVAARENIELSRSGDVQTIVNEISHSRSMRKRNFGGMFDGSPLR